MATTRKKPPEYPFIVLKQLTPEQQGCPAEWEICGTGFEAVTSAKNTKDAVAQFKNALQNNPELVGEDDTTFLIASLRTTEIIVKRVTKPTVELPPGPWSLALKRPDSPGD